jgi:circadian clock protein KaiC
MMRDGELAVGMLEGSRASGPDGSISSGIPGLDHTLQGGFAPNRLYLVEGLPGSGKTTLAVQFLMEGARRGEAVLYLTLSESAEELREMAASHGWSLDGVTIREVLPAEASPEPAEQYTMFHPAEVELGQTMKTILADVDRLQPRRAVIDALSELRLLAGNSLRFRRQVLALKHSFAGRGCTLVVLDDLTSADRDLHVQSVVHGVVRLEHLSPEYGGDRRRLRVVKFRGRRFIGGHHDYVISRGGLEVFPRLVAAHHRHATPGERRTTGLPEIDRLLGGGIESGTSTLIVGAPGTGKSTLASHVVWAAAERGETAAMFLFDESIGTLLDRARGLGIDLQPHVDGGRVTMQSIDPAELSPGEFAHAIRDAVERRRAGVVVIDSLNGYLAAMPGERHLTIQLHEMLAYLAQQGVSTLLVGAQQGLIGTQMQSPVDASYLSDCVILLRYFEAQGEIHQAISVVKKRGGRHERTIHQLTMSDGGIRVGEPLRRFRGVLTGVPVLEPPDRQDA